MSLAGLGFGNMGGSAAFCHMCSSTQCHHIWGAQQNMNNIEAYRDALRQYGAQQQGVHIGVASGGGGASSSGQILISDGSSGISFTPPKKQINKKLLLLRR